MNKPMYVTLDPLIFDDTKEAQDTKLVKRVSEDYLGKTFGELLDKMVDEKVDELNPEAYTAQDMQNAYFVKSLLRQANTDPNSMRVYALSKDEPAREIFVNLNDKVSSYSDRILQEETVFGCSGEKKFHRIDLILDHVGKCC